MEAKLRRYQYILGTAGFGVLIFCIWSVIKAVIFALLQETGYQEIEEESVEADMLMEEILKEAGPGIEAFLIILVILIFAVVILELVLRIYVGRTARLVSRGQKKGPAYLVAAVILAALYLYTIVTGISHQSYLKETYFDTVITFLIDVTSFGTLTAMIVAGIQVRRLTRLIEKQKKEEEAACR